MPPSGCWQTRALSPKFGEHPIFRKVALQVVVILGVAKITSDEVALNYLLALIKLLNPWQSPAQAWLIRVGPAVISKSPAGNNPWKWIICRGCHRNHRNRPSLKTYALSTAWMWSQCSSAVSNLATHTSCESIPVSSKFSYGRSEWLNKGSQTLFSSHLYPNWLHWFASNAN